MLVPPPPQLSLPIWLEALLTEKFFNACVAHEDAKKNEKNIFCLDCSLGICPHCLTSHRSHRLLQIRRYVYHDVIRLDDAAKLIDCAFVQSYTTNSAKVVFLKQRPQTRNFRGSGNLCSTCDRSLQDPYLFCSLSCKIDYLARTQAGVSRHLLECDFLTLPEPGWDDGFIMTPDSVLEPAGSSRTSSGSDGGGGGGVEVRTVASTATTEFVKKRRSSLSAAAYRSACRPVCCSTTISETSASLMMSRRKGTPQRAPLY